jgi:hypothetical protein
LDIHSSKKQDRAYSNIASKQETFPHRSASPTLQPQILTAQAFFFAFSRSPLSALVIIITVCPAGQLRHDENKFVLQVDSLFGLQDALTEIDQPSSHVL